MTNLGTTPSPGGTPAPADAATQPSRVGKYEIVRLLGKGGMGAVHEAFDPILERHVAIKVMLPTIAEDAELKQRLEREARAVARLAHPNVVTVYDLGYHSDGSPYIVMELLRGRDLVGIMRQGPPLSLERKVAIVLQVLEGLGSAHKAGIVHRDVKPANVFVTEDGTVKIMDFGVARFSGGSTGTGSVLGTTHYMSPEQVRGERLDGRSDLFSVGTLLCELLGGRRPFDADTPVATLFRIANGEPDLALPPGPEHARFEPVLRRALARQPDDRYATAAEFAAALRAAGERLGERPIDASARAAEAPVASPATTRPPRADPRELFRLLREVQAGSRSGHLHLTAGERRRTLGILKGRVVHGTSDSAGEHLGDLLVERGLIAPPQRDAAVQAMLVERRRLGAVLLERGLLDRSQLEEAIGSHTRAVLRAALDDSGVTFSFEDLSQDLVEAELNSPVAPGQIVLEVSRTLADPALVRGVLGDTTRVIRTAANPLLRYQQITLTPADGFVLSRVDGIASAREIMDLIPLPAEETERSLFSLLCTGIVEYAERESGRVGSRTREAARPRGAKRGAPPDTRPQHDTRREPDTRPAPDTRREPDTRPAPDTQPGGDAAAGTTAEIRSLILEVHARIKLDHFAVLGLPRTASEDAVKAAYSRLARILHPDARLDPALDDLFEMRREAFIRVSAACETLRDPSERARYEQAFSPRPFRPLPGRPAPEAPVTASVVPPATPRVTPPATPNVAASTARAAEPPVAAPAPQPARAARELAPEPASQVVPPPPTPSDGASSRPGIDPRLEPRNLLAAAEELYAGGKYWDAIQQLEPLVVRVGEPMRTEARTLLARAYLKNPHWTRRAEAVLQSALEDAPDHVPALVLLAGIYASGQLASRAARLYRQALSLWPDHPEAVEGLAGLRARSAASRGAEHRAHQRGRQ